MCLCIYECSSSGVVVESGVSSVGAAMGRRHNLTVGITNGHPCVMVTAVEAVKSTSERWNGLLFGTGRALNFT